MIDLKALDEYTNYFKGSNTLPGTIFQYMLGRSRNDGCCALALGPAFNHCTVIIYWFTTDFIKFEGTVKWNTGFTTTLARYVFEFTRTSDNKGILTTWQFYRSNIGLAKKQIEILES